MRTVMPILVTGSVLLPYAAGFVQNSAKIAPADPFIGTIETMKRSIAPLTCVEQKGSRSNLLERTGTVFFVSSNGGFLTAAHALLEMQKPNRYCPITAVTLPEMRWTPEAREEVLSWFAFEISLCRVDEDLDLALCGPLNDLPARGPGSRFEISPVQFDYGTPPDGTSVAFLGFPRYFRDPITARATVAAYRPTGRRNELIPELILDRPAWPGSSGSPVFLADGRVIGVVIASNTDEPGFTIVRSSSALREILQQIRRK
ncbi:MAG TPA: trypsin-like peptidase domain-containing protein [Bryobacteraceae bacterium]